MLSCQPQHVHFPKICIFGKCAEKEVFKDSPYFSSEVACVAACCSVLQCIAVCCCVLKDSSYFASEVGKRDRFIDEKRVGSNGCSSWYGNDSFICVTWLIHMCDMTHSYVWHDSSNGCSWLYENGSFTCVTWLIHMCDMTHPMDVVRCMGMTHSYVWHDSFVCVTWLIHMCDMTHSYVWHDSFICVTW